MGSVIEFSHHRTTVELSTSRAPASGPRPAPGPEDPIRLLLVADDPDDALLIRRLLADAAPRRFTLTHRETAHAALGRLRHGLFDAAVLGLPPGGDGLQCLRSLRDEAGDLPVVVLGDDDGEGQVASLLREGAEDYLQRPTIDLPGLVRSLRFAIERSGARPRSRASTPHQEALAALGFRALAISELDELMAEVSEMVSAVLDVPFVAIERLDPRLDVWLLVGGTGWSRRLFGSPVAPWGEGMLANVALARRGVFRVDSERLGAIGELPHYLRTQKVRHGVVARIATLGEPFGVLSGWERRDRPFSADQALFVDSAASLLGVAVQRLEEEAAARRTSATVC